MNLQTGGGQKIQNVCRRPKWKPPRSRDGGEEGKGREGKVEEQCDRGRGRNARHVQRDQTLNSCRPRRLQCWKYDKDFGEVA